MSLFLEQGLSTPSSVQSLQASDLDIPVTRNGPSYLLLVFPLFFPFGTQHKTRWPTLIYLGFSSCSSTFRFHLDIWSGSHGLSSVQQLEWRELCCPRLTCVLGSDHLQQLICPFSLRLFCDILLDNCENNVIGSFNCPIRLWMIIRSPLQPSSNTGPVYPKNSCLACLYYRNFLNRILNIIRVISSCVFFVFGWLWLFENRAAEGCGNVTCVFI